MSALLALLFAACAPAAAQTEEASRRFDERAAAVEAGVREFELRTPALSGVPNLKAAARAEERRFKDMVAELDALDAAKRRYGIAARMAIASAVVSSVQEAKVTKTDYDNQMTRLERENAMSARSGELGVRLVDAHNAFRRALKAEHGRRRARRAAAGLGFLLAAAAVGAWAWYRAQARPADLPPPSRLLPKPPPRRGPGRLH